MAEALAKRPGSCVARVGADVPVDIGAQILDVELAAEMLAEEGDVGADDRPEVDEDGRVGWCGSADRNFGSAFDGTTGSSPRGAGASPRASG